MCLADLLLGGGHGRVSGILCGLGVRKLFVGGCLGGLGVLDSLLRCIQLGDGVGIRLLGGIEVGRRNVSLSNLKKIADGFQISIAELMRGVS